MSRDLDDQFHDILSSLEQTIGHPRSSDSAVRSISPGARRSTSPPSLFSKDTPFFSPALRRSPPSRQLIDWDKELTKQIDRIAEPVVSDALDRLSEDLHDRQETIYDMLRRLDRNKDGKLKRDELRSALFDQNVSLSVSELDALMRVFDANGDGYIDYVEFYNTLTRHRVRNILKTPKQKLSPRETAVRYDPRETAVRYAKSPPRSPVIAPSSTMQLRKLDRTPGQLELVLREMKSAVEEMAANLRSAMIGGFADGANLRTLREFIFMCEHSLQRAIAMVNDAHATEQNLEIHVDELHIKLKESLTNSAKLQQHVEVLQQEHTRTEIAHSESEVRLKSLMQELQVSEVSAKERVNMLVDENTKLQQKLQTAMAAMERAQVRIKDESGARVTAEDHTRKASAMLISKGEEANRSLLDSEAKKSWLQTQNEKQAQQISELESRLEELRRSSVEDSARTTEREMVLSTKVGQLAAALEAAERKGTMVADSNNQLEQHLAQATAREHDLQKSNAAEIMALKDELRRMVSECDVAKDNSHSLQVKLDKMESSLRGTRAAEHDAARTASRTKEVLDDTVKSHQQVHAKLQFELERISSSNQNLVSEISHKDDELRKTMQQLQAVEDSLRRVEANLLETTERADKSHTENEVLRHKNERLEQQVRDFEEQMRLIRIKMSESDKVTHHVVQELRSQLQEEITKSEHHIRNATILEAEADQAKAALRESNNREEELRERARHTSADLHAKVEELMRVQADSTQLKSDLGTAKSAEKDLARQLETLMQRNRELHTECSERQADVEVLRHKNETLEHEIQELNSAVEQARRAAMMIETEASAKLHEIGSRLNDEMEETARWANLSRYLLDDPSSGQRRATASAKEIRAVERNQLLETALSQTRTDP